MIWSLSPAQFFWEVFPSALASAIRFCSLLELKVAVPFLLHPASKVLTQQKESKSLRRTPRYYYLISPARDLPHSTKPSLPDLARFGLPDSSESTLRSVRHARAQL